jgi:homopolymeric O-antigen transport system permease protein
MPEVVTRTEQAADRQAAERAVDAALPERRDTAITVIRPPRGLPRLDVLELWRFRELAFRILWRDIKVRYKQTSIGVAWALLQPFLTMVVLTFVFGRYAGFPSQGLPYEVFLFSALLPWTYFQQAVTASSASLVSNVALVTKVYFPRTLLPLSAVAVPLVDFALSLSVLAGLMVWFEIAPAGTVAFAPLFLGLAFVTALGVGLFFSALNVRFRDVPYAIPFLVQIWFYLSPAIYPTADLPEHWQWIFSLNPMTGAITGFRWALLDTPAPEPAQFAVSVVSALVIFLAGLAFFRRTEATFADTI